MGQDARADSNPTPLRKLRLRPHRLAHSPARLRRAIAAGAALACTLTSGPIPAASGAEPSPETPPREQLTIAPEEL